MPAHIVQSEVKVWTGRVLKRFYKNSADSLLIERDETSVKIFLTDEEYTWPIWSAAGYYTIFNGPVPLYTGFSAHSVGNRVYRFFKELAGLSRHDESHSAAKKFRLNGGKLSWPYQLRTVYLSDLIEDYGELPSFTTLNKIDTRIAIKFKSRYNTATIIDII